MQTVLPSDTNLIGAYWIDEQITAVTRDGKKCRYWNLEEIMNDKKGMGRFTEEQFLEICILAGCDFLPSIPYVGMKKAIEWMLACQSYKKV